MKSSRLAAAAGVASDRALLASIRHGLAAELGIPAFSADGDDLPAETIGALQQLPIAIYAIGADGAIRWHNDAAVALWGRRPAIGCDLWCGAPRLLNAAGESVAPEHSPAAIALASGEPAGAKLIVDRPDDVAMPISALAMPRRDAAGNVIGAIVTLVELTAPSASDHERYRLVAQASDDVI